MLARKNCNDLSDPRNMRALACIIEHPQTARSLSKHMDITFNNVYRYIRTLELYGLIRTNGTERGMGRGQPSGVYHSTVRSLDVKVTAGKVAYIAKYNDGRTEEIIMDQGIE